MVSSVTIVVCVVLLAWYARVRAGDPDRGVAASTSELAYLRGGPVLALLASLFWLRAHDLVATAGRGRIVRTGPVPAGADALTRAVLLAVDGVGSWPEIVSDGRVGFELVRLRRRLIVRGWLISERALRLLRRAAIVPGVGVVVTSFATGGAGAEAWWGTAAYVVAIVTGAVLVASPEKTRAGVRALRRYRPPARHAAGVEGGPAGDRIEALTLALAVGDMGVLWRYMPVFAVEAGVPATLNLTHMWMPPVPTFGNS